MSDRGKKFFGLKELVEKTKKEQKKMLGEAKTLLELKAEKAEAKEKAEEILKEPIVSPPEAEAVSVEGLETAKKKLVERYGNASIYRLAGRTLLHYELPVPRPTASEKAIINTVKEAATRLISISPYRIRDPEQRRNVYFNQIMDILRSSKELSIPKGKYEFYANAIVREMVGYGLIDDLIRDDQLEEIMIIGPRKPVYVFHRKYEMMTTNIEFYNDEEIQDLINRIARGVGRRVDISSPLLDARLPDGSRVNATIAPASVSGSTLTIRKFREDPYSIIDLVNMKTLSLEAAAFLWLCVDGLGVKPANVLIAGGTGSGKTTTLNVLAAFIPDTERIISIEDTAELNLPLNHWIRFEARPPGLEGKGELTMDILTKNSLRMRPNRIIVGEVRHQEAFTLFTAMNTGHDGALTGDSLIQLADGNLVKIGKLAENYFQDRPALSDGGFEFVNVAGESIFVPTLNKQTLQMEDKRVTRIWRKKISSNIKQVTLRSGKTLSLTSDHPVYRIDNGLQEISCSRIRSGDFIAVPKAIEISCREKAFEPYLAGLVYGDGHVGQGRLDFVNTDKTLMESFGRIVSKHSANKVSQRDFKKFFRTRIWDKKLVDKVCSEYSLFRGNKTKRFKVEGKIIKTSNKQLASFLRGLFDCEAHVNLHSNSIQFSTANNDLARKLPLLLSRFGIAASLSQQALDGKGNFGPYYRISIYGKDNLAEYAKSIGFDHSMKRKKLVQLLAQASAGEDLIPNSSRLLKRARLESDITQLELNRLLNCQTRSTIEAYETSKRNPTRRSLKRILSFLEASQAKKILRMLVEAQVRFEKVVKVEDVQFDGIVYDLTVEANHNYIANGIIVSNCLGTIHANSPEETIVRVTSPPMNVPELMIAGLDLVVIEHRIHDRKKGTIRRLTEIAEVRGVLEGKTRTVDLFKRNAAKDKLVRTKKESAYLSLLQALTGLKKSQIAAELKRREKTLKRIQDKGIRRLVDVVKETQKYMVKKAGEKVKF